MPFHPKRLILLAALLALAACGQPAPPPTTATATNTLLDITAPRFVGRWATSEALCGGGSWEFTATGVTTAMGVSCSFNRVDTVPGGYDISAVCSSIGPAAPQRIQIRFPESAGGMLVDGGASVSAGLVPCRSGLEQFGTRPR